MLAKAGSLDDQDAKTLKQILPEIRSESTEKMCLKGTL